MLIGLRPLLTNVGLNSLWLLIARISSQGMAFVLTILVVRYLGQDGLGQYAFVAAVVFIGNVVTTFGLDTFLIREVAQRRAASGASVTASLGIQLAFSALFIGGVFLGSDRLLESCCPRPMTAALRIYSLALIPLAFTTTFNSVLRAYERVDLILALNLLSAVVQMGGTWLLLSSGQGLVALVALVVGVQILAGSASGLICLRYLPGLVLNVRISTGLIRRMLRQGLPLVLLAALMVVYQRMGVLMLSFLTGDSATGWFAAAARVTDMVKMIHYAFLGAIFPMMSRLSVNELTRDNPVIVGPEHGLFQASLPVLLTIAVVAAPGLTLLAGPLIRLLYAAHDTPATQALQILAWSLIPFAINTYTFFWLVSNGKETTALRVSTASLIIIFVLYTGLIPAFGLVGACLATLLGEAVQGLLYLPYIRRVKMWNQSSLPYKESAHLGPSSRPVQIIERIES